MLGRLATVRLGSRKPYSLVQSPYRPNLTSFGIYTGLLPKLQLGEATWRIGASFRGEHSEDSESFCNAQLVFECSEAIELAVVVDDDAEAGGRVPLSRRESFSRKSLLQDLLFDTNSVLSVMHLSAREALAKARAPSATPHERTLCRPLLAECNRAFRHNTPIFYVVCRTCLM